MTIEAPPPGARCASHPEIVAAGACSRCGTFGCGQCLGGPGGICAGCRSAGHDAWRATPWEQRDDLGWGPAIFLTLRDLTTSPQAFFERMNPHEGLGAAMGLWLLLMTITELVGVGYRRLWALQGAAAVREQLAPLIDLLSFLPSWWIGFLTGENIWLGLAVLPLSLLMTFLGLVFGAAMYHSLLRFYGSGRNGLEATLKVTFYGSLVSVWRLLPLAIFPYFAILLVPWIWMLNIIGYSAIHGDRWTKGALAVGTPVVLASCGLLLLLLAIMGLAAFGVSSGSF